MNRNAIAAVSLGLLFVILGTLVDKTTKGLAQTRFELLLFGLFTSTVGAFVLLRRKLIVQENLLTYNRSPESIRGIYTAWYRLLRFERYEQFVLANTILVGTVALVMGLIALGFFTYRLATGL